MDKKLHEYLKGVSMLSKENELLEAALGYAASGIRVVPVYRPTSDGKCNCGNENCSSIGKHPSISKWQENASTDPALIKDWFSRGDRNVGIVTGVKSGVFVLDIDGRHGGFESLSLMENRYGAFPPTITVVTPGGGEHRYFICNEVLGNKVKLSGYDGIDIRAEKGFVVAPPSLHQSGGFYAFK